MNKILAVFLVLPLFAVSEVYAQQTEALETELDRKADNLNVIPAEVRLGLKREVNQNMNLKLKNSTKGEVSDIVKNINLYEQRSAKVEGRAPARAVHVDPNNKNAVKKLLQKDLNVDSYPKLYE